MCTKKCCGNLLKSGLKSTSPDLTSRGMYLSVDLYRRIYAGFDIWNINDGNGCFAIHF